MPNSMTSLLTLSLLLSGTISVVVDSLAFSPSSIQLPSFLNGILPSSPSATKKTLQYTHLEGNGQLWTAATNKRKASIVIDPIASQLDFGIPQFYRANKLALTESQTIEMICDAQPTHCLLCMGWDDHTHLPTLKKMKEELPELMYVVAPSCLGKLKEIGIKESDDNVIVLDHGESCQISEGVTVMATEGSLVGPPWQKRENGYLLQLDNDDDNDKEDSTKDDAFSIYYEPHADVILNNLQNVRADVMISPVVKQALPAGVPPEGQYTLVYGGDRTLQIAEHLGVKAVIPLGNAELDFEGPLVDVVQASGDEDEFEMLVGERNVGQTAEVKAARAKPGVPLTVSV